MTTEDKEIKTWISKYRNQYGFNVIPAPTKEKLPKIKWKEYQDTFPDDKTVEAWDYENIFLILGEISNNTIEIDVDVPHIQLEDIFKNVKAAEETFLIAESSQGKKKIYVKAKNIKEKIDSQVSNEQIGTNKKGEPLYPHVEYRGNKHGSILPPSIHPDGTEYRWLNRNEKGEIPELHETDADKVYENIVKRLREKFEYIPERKEETEDGKQEEKKRKKRPRYCFMMSHNNGDKWSGPEGHDFRSAYAWELILCNYPDEEIYDAFKTHDEASGESYDEKVTKDQVQRIRKKAKYQWFCKTIQEKCGSIVSKYCEECVKREKKDISLYVSTFPLPDGKQLEEIMVDGKECFILYDSNTDKWEIVEDYLYGDTPIKPYIIPEEMKEAVIFPDGVEEYGTLLELQKEMDTFALEEYDPVDNKDLYGLHVLLSLTSWISPIWQRKSTEKFIPILNARGPSETGKKRYLTIQRWLTYHSLYGLKTNRVPTLFRAIAPIEGTLILDEADMNDSTLNAELVEFLNSRCDGVPIPRLNKDNNVVNWWKSFGLTILATRQGFSDDGLESRCVVMPTATTDNPSNYHLIPPKEWIEKGRQLQRKLLLFRLRHIKGEMPTQLILPNISSFRVRESLLIIQGLKDEDPALMPRVERLAKDLQERIIKERSASPEGLILNIVYNTLFDERTHLEVHGLGYIVVTEVKKKKNPIDPIEEDPRTEDSQEEINYYPLTLKKISQSLGEAFSPSVIAKMWRGLNQDTVSLKKINNRSYRGVVLVKNVKRLDRIFPKYVVDYERPSVFKIQLGDGQRELPA